MTRAICSAVTYSICISSSLRLPGRCRDDVRLYAKLAKAGDGDFLRSMAAAVFYAVWRRPWCAADGFGRTVAEGRVSRPKNVAGLIGAGRHERSVERSTYRNGYRDRT